MNTDLIGPGPECSECGEVYGLHRDDCKKGARITAEHAKQKAEDSISKKDLLKRIKRLEKLFLERRNDADR